MQLAAFSSGLHRASEKFERWFPTPRLLTPRSVGVDISDTSIKWLGLSQAKDGGYRVSASGSEALQSGMVAGGIVRDVAGLAAVLREVRKKLGNISCAHAALPEEAAYVFSMRVPAGSREQILRLIEFEFEGRVPIPPSVAVYDFDVIAHHGDELEIGVSVFPRELAESYTQAFTEAGWTIFSLEIEARSIARAVSGPDDPVVLIADFGIARTGFAVVQAGVPIFTSTVEVGGSAITKAIKDTLKLSDAETDEFKNEEGIAATRSEAKPAVEEMSKTANELSDEIARHFHYWDTRRGDRGERLTPVERVILVGGSSNLKGLPDFIASKVQAPVERGNVWRNICEFDEYVPPIDRRTSLQFATAAGLALRSV